MIQEYKEPRFPTATLSPEVDSHIEMTHQDNSDFENFLAGLDFEVQKCSPSPQSIEQLREAYSLPIFNRVSMLLAALGEKPASSVVISSEDWRTGELENDLPEYIASKVFESATALGLHVRTRDILDSNEELDTHWKSRLYSVSLSERNAEVLAQVMWSKDPVDELILGKVLGFPDTAVVAYATQGEMVSSDEHPHETLEDKTFTQFRLSAGNYNAELQTVRRWTHAIKQADQIFYNQAMRTRLLL